MVPRWFPPLCTPKLKTSIPSQSLGSIPVHFVFMVVARVPGLSQLLDPSIHTAMVTNWR